MRVRVATAGRRYAVDVDSPAAAVDLLGALSAISAEEILRYGLPSVYASGVRYRREWGPETFESAANIHRLGYADCDGLTAWRVGELQASGADRAAAPMLVRVASGYHALVSREGGRYYEDPSAVLGMRRQRVKIDVLELEGGRAVRIVVPLGVREFATAYGEGRFMLEALASAAATMAEGLAASGVPVDAESAPMEAVPMVPADAATDLNTIFAVSSSVFSGSAVEVAARIAEGQRAGAAPAVLDLLRRGAREAGVRL